MSEYDPRNKLLGSYLIEAGLLSPSQVEVILNDQKATQMRFGDIVVERGWINKQTLEYIMGKVITLEREMGQPLKEQVFQDAHHRRKKRKSGSIL